MSPNPNKLKGSRWERELAQELQAFAELSKRIPGSGALGTIVIDPRLTGDVVVKYKFLNKPFKVECKYGYGGSTQMTVKRGWMEKVCTEAEANDSYPALAIKFRDVTNGHKSAKMICMTVEDWNRMMGELSELFDDLQEFWDWKYGED